MVEPPPEEQPRADGEEGDAQTLKRWIARRCDSACDGCESCDGVLNVLPDCDVNCDPGCNILAPYGPARC